jgi:proteic killer suppression protein
MIHSFGDRLTEDIYHGRETRAVKRIAPDLRRRATRKLDMLEAAHRLDDLRSPPGNRLEALSADLRGFYSIRVTDQWRLVFRWERGAAEQVRLTDYH